MSGGYGFPRPFRRVHIESAGGYGFPRRICRVANKKRNNLVRCAGGFLIPNKIQPNLSLVRRAVARMTQRGLRARVETGLWPGMAPLGYLNQKLLDRRCELIIDKKRAPIVKLIFRKAASDWSGRKLYHWLKDDLKFTTRGDKYLTLSGIYRMLTNPFYYGMFEYSRKSGNWYRGKHTPLIAEALFQKVQVNLKREETRREAGEFVFTKLISCGYCGSSIIAEQKFVKRKDGTATLCVYYGCSRAKNRECKNAYLTEVKLMNEISRNLAKIQLNEIGVRMQIEAETERFKSLQGIARRAAVAIDPDKVDVTTYAKHLLTEGGESEKRKFLSNLRSMLILLNQKIEVMS